MFHSFWKILSNFTLEYLQLSNSPMCSLHIGFFLYLCIRNFGGFFRLMRMSKPEGLF